jgi:hypothetical protein
MLFPNPLGVPNILERLFPFALDVLKQLEGLNELPSLFQNIGMALLSILIPLAIAILVDVYQKKRDKEEDFIVLDLNVILDCVFHMRRLIIFSLLIFLPFVFWEQSHGLLRLLEIVLSSIGICVLIRTILNVYSWTKGSVFDFRFSYLEKLEEGSSDFATVWKSVWNAKEIDRQSEIRFFNVFSSKIDDVVNKYEKRH